MIEYLTRNQLNVKKYDNCIAKAFNTRIYAYSWFLNSVCDDFDVLVMNDYQSVMPLPKRKKYGINYVYQAPWIQQLGVFSKDKIEENLVQEFINAIPKKFKLIDVFLNSENTITSKHITIRDNFVLPLNNSYKAIRKQYSKGRKSSIKQAENFNLEVVESYSPVEIIQLFKENKGAELNKKDSDYEVLSALVNHALSINHVKCYAVVTTDKVLIGGAFFLMDKHRITYLFSAINVQGREKHAMSFLIDTVIKTNAETNYIFDFEGSVLQPLASFFKSFGAEKEMYYWYKKGVWKK